MAALKLFIHFFFLNISLWFTLNFLKCYSYTKHIRVCTCAKFHRLIALIQRLVPENMLKMGNLRLFHGTVEWSYIITVYLKSIYHNVGTIIYNMLCAILIRHSAVVYGAMK